MAVESGLNDAFVSYEHQRPDIDARRAGEIEGATEAVNEVNVDEIQEIEAENVEAGVDGYQYYTEDHDEGQEK